jgi:hypothetical protein
VGELALRSPPSACMYVAPDACAPRAQSHEVTKVTLRAKSQERMVDWCVAVNGAPPATA